MKITRTCGQTKLFLCKCIKLIKINNFIKLSSEIFSINLKVKKWMKYQSVCQPNQVIQKKNKNNTSGCLKCGVWTTSCQHKNESKNQPLLATTTSITSLFWAKHSNIKQVDRWGFWNLPKLYSTKLREGERFDRQHGYKSPHLQSTVLRP